MSPTQDINGQTRSFEVYAFGWPLITSGVNAFCAFLDESAGNAAAKQALEAKKRGGDVKY